MIGHVAWRLTRRAFVNLWRAPLPSLMAVLNSLDRASLEQKRPPTLPLLRELMQTSFDLDKDSNPS